MPEDRVQPSMAEQAYRRIEEMIVTRALSPGAMISEKMLMDELGAGRTPVREALQRLRLEGYIEVHPSRGIQVSTIDVFRQFELLEVRRPLEDVMVRLASQRATASERARMLSLADEIMSAAAVRDRGAFLKANRDVHQTLAQASRNVILANSISTLHGLSRRFWYSYIEDGDVFEAAAKLHGLTLRSVSAGEETEAAQHAREFLNFLEDLSREALNQRIDLNRQRPTG